MLDSPFEIEMECRYGLSSARSMELPPLFNVLVSDSIVDVAKVSLPSRTILTDYPAHQLILILRVSPAIIQTNTELVTGQFLSFSVLFSAL